MDRITFFRSVKGIQYPDVLVHFFDHFLALKSIVEESGSVNVDQTDQNAIVCTIKFRTKLDRDNALKTIAPQMIMVYGKPIQVSVDILAGNQIKIILF